MPKHKNLGMARIRQQNKKNIASQDLTPNLVPEDEKGKSGDQYRQDYKNGGA